MASIASTPGHPNTVQRRARRVLRGGPGGEIPPCVAPEQRLRGAFLAHVIPPEALLRGYTRGKTALGPPPHGSSPSSLHWFVLIEPHWGAPWRQTPGSPTSRQACR